MNFPFETNAIYKRTIVRDIIKYLFTDDVIILHGARQTGKTHILYLIENYLTEQKFKTDYIDLEDSRFVKVLNSGTEEFVKLLKERGIDFKNLRKEEKIFVLIDEIQYLNTPSSFLKIIADHYKYIKLVVTGSSSFAIKSKFKDSLVGRTVNFEILPLSFIEFLDFKGLKTDGKVLKDKDLTQKTVDELKILFKEYVLYGGYPKIVLTDNLEFKEKYLQQIIDTYIKKDIRDLANIKDIDKFNKLVEILASQSGQMINVMELSNTCKLAKQSVENYLFILENTYIIKLVKPFHKNIRSELSKTPKVFFYDSGLAQMIWLKQLQKETTGNMFETGVFGELIKKYGADNVLYWRTADKKEIDFILKKGHQILPIEVKMNLGKFNKTSMSYFCDTYKTKDYIVTGMDGMTENKHFHYPWSL